MAKHLARIHGTEEDKVNCPFYFKIGACRHSDRCSRLHHRPAFSPTILIKHLYRHPVRKAELLAAQQGTPPQPVDEKEAMEDFLCYFEDMYLELSKFGRIEQLHVCDNLGDHMIGHTYCKFSEEEEAGDALMGLQGRYYDGRLLQVEFSPVTDFREARCRDFDEGNCSRGGFCNFLHAKPVPMCLIRSLEEDADDMKREEEERKYEEERKERKRKKRSHRDEGRKKSRRTGSRHDDSDSDEGDRRKRRSRSYSRSASRSRSPSKSKG